MRGRRIQPLGERDAENYPAALDEHREGVREFPQRAAKTQPRPLLIPGGDEPRDGPAALVIVIDSPSS